MKNLKKWLNALLDSLYRFLSSLKLAVFVISSLAISQAIATFIESIYDIPMGRYYVYDTRWFYGLMGLLGVNIFMVAASRFPWKRRHVPFLMAHVGILTLLTGSWITSQHGVDAQLMISEGSLQNSLSLTGNAFYIKKGSKLWVQGLPFKPPDQKFDPTEVKDFRVTIDRYITHADERISFRDVKNRKAGKKARPAIHVKLVSERARVFQDFWLWSGDMRRSRKNFGPALFAIVDRVVKFKNKKKGGKGMAGIMFQANKDGGLSYQVSSRDGSSRVRKIARESIVNSEISPGWMDFKVTVMNWIPDAEDATIYKPSRLQYGDQAPQAAIRISYQENKSDLHTKKLWLGKWNRKNISLDGKSTTVEFTAMRRSLPFFIQLKRFKIDYHVGSRDPSEFSSQVRVIDGDQAPKEPILISMNEPLTYGGYTFYQSSYIPGQPRPTTSIFSVNKDPGRWIKYGGCILIVLGSILLFSLVGFLSSRCSSQNLEERYIPQTKSQRESGIANGNGHDMDQEPEIAV